MDESSATDDDERTVCGETFPDEPSLHDHRYSVGQVY
jgi:hypothetical protein